MKKFKNFPSQLQIRTHQLLVNASVTSKQIASDTGLSEAWLSDFLKSKNNGRVSIGRVETLYNYLAPAPLQVP